MKILKQKKEQYLNTIQVYGKPSNIYINPTVSELIDLTLRSKYDEFSFIIDNRHKTIYSFDCTVLHSDVCKFLKLSYPSDKILPGLGYFKGKNSYSKISGTLIDLISSNPELVRKLCKQNWKWANKYIYTQTLLDDIMERLSN